MDDSRTEIVERVLASRSADSRLHSSRITCPPTAAKGTMKQALEAVVTVVFLSMME